MLIHHEDYLPDCVEYVHGEFPPLIVDADDFDSLFVKSLARTESPDTEEGNYICAHCIGLAMAGDEIGLRDDDRGDDDPKDI